MRNAMDLQPAPRGVTMWLPALLAGVLLSLAPAVLPGSGAARAAERVEPFTLLDQTGQPHPVAPSEQKTLITLYRGDW